MPNTSNTLDRVLVLEMVRVTEAAAIAAAKWIGRGDNDAADAAAVEAMREQLNKLPMDGTVVIGEGERDEAPMLYIGEKVGSNPRDEDVPGYFASVRQSVGSRWQLIGELGRRELPSGDQDVLGLQAPSRMGDKVLRVGGALGRHDAGHSDQLVYAGINVPLGERLSIDPTLYLSETGIDEDSEWRGVVNLEYRGNPNWTTGVFAGGGTIDATDPAFAGSTFVAGAWANFAVAERHTLHFLVRREDAPSAAFTVAEVGFTHRLPGN